MSAPPSLLRLLHESLKRDDRREFFGAVAARVRTGLLTNDESELIARWFEQIADGNNPEDVLFGERRGRKPNANTATYLKGRDVSLPDHVDLCWSIRRWIAQTSNEEQIFKIVAKHFGKTTDHIRRLYRRIEPTLAPDPSLTK